MLTSHRHLASLAVAALLIAACDDGDAIPVEVGDFRVHECNTSRVTHQFLTGRNAPDYVGLQCVAWHFGDDRTAIDLINQPAGCVWGGNDEAGRTLWKPTITKLASGALRYRVEWDFESPSACGLCLHGFSVEFGALTNGKPLELELGVRDCNDDCDWQEDSIRLPLDEVAAGVACKYVDWNRHDLEDRDKGKLHTPPRAGDCDAQLVASDDGRRCLAPCEADADCPLPDLLRCIDASCRLKDSW